MHFAINRFTFEKISPPPPLLHPTKTLVRYGLLAWTSVSANSEKCRGSQWAVMVGQRLSSRFGQSGTAQELGLVLVQIVVEASAIRGGFPNTSQTEPVFGWRCQSVLGDYGKGLPFRTTGYKLYILETMACSWLP